uniref:Uncharacterized protein n=1 Tax=Arundo donax TaxID=35708 RepID=A0A0A8YJI6_ARUDO
MFQFISPSDISLIKLQVKCCSRFKDRLPCHVGPTQLHNVRILHKPLRHKLFKISKVQSI